MLFIYPRELLWSSFQVHSIVWRVFHYSNLTGLSPWHVWSRRLGHFSLDHSRKQKHRVYLKNINKQIEAARIWKLLEIQQRIWGLRKANSHSCGVIHMPCSPRIRGMKSKPKSKARNRKLLGHLSKKGEERIGWISHGLGVGEEGGRGRQWQERRNLWTTGFLNLEACFSMFILSSLPWSTKRNHTSSINA